MSTTDSTRVRPTNVERAWRQAARRLVTRWLLALAVVVALLVLATALVLLVWQHAGQPGWVSVMSLYFVAVPLYLLYQLLPLRPRPIATTPLDADADSELRDWVHACTGWRPQVRLSHENGVRLVVHHDLLVLGMPVLAGLSEAELALLVRDVDRQRRADRTHVLVGRLVHGDIGRGLWSRPDGRLARWFLRLCLEQPLVRVHRARAALADESRASETAWEALEERLEVVTEAWDHLCEAWLAPALLVGRWHHDPFSGLRVFLGSCELAGVVPPSRRSAEDPDVWDRWPLAEREQLVAERLYGGSRPAGTAISWEEHPSLVEVTTWRAVASAAVAALVRVVGHPVPASPDALAWAVRGRQRDWAVEVDPQCEAGESGPGPAVARAVAALCLVDAGLAVPTWEWPRGAVLQRPTGEELSLAGAVDLTTLPAWLRSEGVDPSVPLWLGEGAPAEPDRALWAFDVVAGVRRRRMVVATRALHVFPRGVSQFRAVRELWDGHDPESDPCLRAVDEGRTGPEVESHDWDDVVSLHLRPRALAWGSRVSARLVDGRDRRFGTVLGLPEYVVQDLRSLVGDRLVVPAYASSRWRRVATRTWSYLTGVTGLLMALGGGLGWSDPPPGTTRDDAWQFGSVGLLLVLLAFAPHLLTAFLERRRLRVFHRRTAERTIKRDTTPPA